MFTISLIHLLLNSTAQKISKLYLFTIHSFHVMLFVKKTSWVFSTDQRNYKYLSMIYALFVNKWPRYWFFFLSCYLFYDYKASNTYWFFKLNHFIVWYKLTFLFRKNLDCSRDFLQITIFIEPEQIKKPFKKTISLHDSEIITIQR